MARLTEQEIREKITNLFLMTYLPKMKKEVARFMGESDGKMMMAYQVSEICGKEIGIPLGSLRVAEPTNEIIDTLVKLYVQQEA